MNLSDHRQLSSPQDLPVDNGHSCDAGALDWALLVLTIITTHVTWWAIPLPTLFREGFRQYCTISNCSAVTRHSPLGRGRN
jgi:hypothetical protein